MQQKAIHLCMPCGLGHNVDVPIAAKTNGVLALIAHVANLTYSTDDVVEVSRGLGTVGPHPVAGVAQPCKTSRCVVPGVSKEY